MIRALKKNANRKFHLFKYLKTVKINEVNKVYIRVNSTILTIFRDKKRACKSMLFFLQEITQIR